MKLNCAPILCTLAASATASYHSSYGSYGSYNYNKPSYGSYNKPSYGSYNNNYNNNNQPEPDAEPESDNADEAPVLDSVEKEVEEIIDEIVDEIEDNALVDENPNIYHANHHDDNEACTAKKLLNDHRQIEVGFNTNKCIAVSSNFSNIYGLKGKSQVSITDCKDYQCPTQCFTQVYFDENDKSKFGICLKKYHDGPASFDKNWSPKYWCLFGKFSITKIGKAKGLNALSSDAKWQWSFNEHGKLINGNLGGRTLNVNAAGKLKLLPGEEIWSFGHHFVDFKDDGEDLW